jgi:hypothetical protein
MPFLAEEHIDIPTTDLLSWMFDEQTYDADKPVNGTIHMFVIAQAEYCRSTSTQQNLNDLYHQIKRKV